MLHADVSTPDKAKDKMSKKLKDRYSIYLRFSSCVHWVSAQCAFKLLESH